MEYVKKIKYICNAVIDYFCMIGLSLSTILMTLQILNRYIFRLPIMWLSDLSLFCFIFFALIVAIVTTRERGHIAVDVFREKYFKDNPRRDTMYSIIMDVISILVVGFFLILTREFMLQAIKYPEYSTLIRWFNTSWLRISLFFSYFFIFVELIILLIKNFKKIKNLC